MLILILFLLTKLNIYLLQKQRISDVRCLLVVILVYLKSVALSCKNIKNVSYGYSSELPKRNLISIVCKKNNWREKRDRVCNKEKYNQANSNLTLISFNICSLNNKMHELEQIVEKFNEPHIIVVSETWIEEGKKIL